MTIFKCLLKWLMVVVSSVKDQEKVLTMNDMVSVKSKVTWGNDWRRK